MIGDRSFDGDPIDWTWQYIGDRPELDEEAEEVAYATDPEEGEETTEGVPIPGESESDQESVQRPDVDGQSTLTDWEQAGDRR